jgi:copper homeostasis protein CutC
MDALISGEVDSGFETWKAAVESRNKSLDISLNAKIDFENAENSLAVVAFEYHEESKKIQFNLPKVSARVSISKSIKKKNETSGICS